MDPLQIKRLHDRLRYLEDELSGLYRFLKVRFDAAIKESVPAPVAVARATDEAVHDEA